ncbi:MAG: hypothetical protein GY875_24130 [Gammaproteobacteria bacterium]|nr:hypothetical protein [Gammaproteobacteria bacterium]
MPEERGTPHEMITQFLGQSFFLGFPNGTRGFYDDGNPNNPNLGLGGYTVRHDRPFFYTTTSFNDDVGPPDLAHPFAGNFLVRTPAIEYCDIQLNADSFTTGDVLQADVFSIGNPESNDRALEWKAWFVQPSGEFIPAVNVGADGSLVLTAEFSHDFGSLSLFGVDAASARGDWELNCRVLDPTTGQQLHFDRNVFSIDQ